MMDGQRDHYIDNHAPTATTPPGTPPSVTPAVYARIKHLASQGHSRSEVAKIVGLHRETVSKVPGIDWPKRGYAKKVIEHRERQKASAWRNKRSREALAHPLGKKHRLPDGRMLTVREIVEETGISAKTIRTRIMRGNNLLAPVDPRKPGQGLGWRSKTWRVDISRDDWEIVLEYAREHGGLKAHRKFGVPEGAINALLRGETWRVVGFEAD